jgi:hypothetical protein
MSIYEGFRPPRWKPPPRVGEPTKSAGPPVHRRKAQPVDVLLPRTKTWIASLPMDARPDALAKQYARIANNFASCWDSSSECARYFGDLLIDRRGDRRGLPPEVVREIQRLRALYTVRSGASGSSKTRG